MQFFLIRHFFPQNVYKIVKMTCYIFSELKVTSLNISLYLMNDRKSKDIQFIIMCDTEKLHGAICLFLLY